MNPSHLSFNLEEGEVGGENSEEHSAAVQPDDVEKCNQNSTVGELAENIDSNNSQQSSPSSTPVKLKTLEEIYASSFVPIDSCHLGAHNPVFLQQASCVTGGVYVKSQQVSFVNHRPSISFAPVVAVQWRICSISTASQQQQCSRPEERGENTKKQEEEPQNRGKLKEKKRSRRSFPWFLLKETEETNEQRGN
uniref:Uncharacterized protein n=1 Tax=Populus alba TaxID=43335 RepID=A0A4U5PVM0_POPAL|nr:hypothetical protein D5086_0000178530 [Populus alba]